MDHDDGLSLADLAKEYEACRSIGVKVDWADEAPVPLPQGTRALRFPDQARFHPLKYCAGLALAIHAIPLVYWIMIYALFDLDLQETLVTVVVVGVIQGLAACVMLKA